MIKKNELTIKQEKLLKFFSNKSNWQPPTYSQMAKYMGVSRQRTFEMMKSIKKQMGEIIKRNTI